MKFLRLTWIQIEKMCISLARKVARYKPEVIVAISRGGLVPGRILSDILDISDVQVIRVKFYRTVGETELEPKIFQGQDLIIKGKKVLVVDDVADSGKSLAVIRAYLKRKNPAELKFATIHCKPISIFIPDFYVEETDKWVIYPWEKLEVKRELKELRTNHK